MIRKLLYWNGRENLPIASTESEIVNNKAPKLAPIAPQKPHVGLNQVINARNSILVIVNI